MRYMIVAYDQDRAIGGKGTIPWIGKLPADMRHFKQMTTGSTVIMGRHTFNSIGKPLPNRRNIVVTRNNVHMPGIEVARSIKEAFELSKKDEKVFIIGGGQIYAETLPNVEIVYATEIATYSGGTVFFPKLDSTWQETERQDFTRDDQNAFDYSFATYTKQQ